MIPRNQNKRATVMISHASFQLTEMGSEGGDGWCEQRKITAHCCSMALPPTSTS